MAASHKATAAFVLPAPKLVLKNGGIAKVPAKPARIKRVPIALPARLLGMMFVASPVLDEIEFQRRLILLRAVEALIAAGFSQNRSADAMGIGRGLLSVWRKKFAAKDAEALRPTPWNAGRRPAKGRARRHQAFVEFVTARR